MADTGAPLAHSPFRFLALIWLAFSAVGAGWLFLLGSLVEEFENAGSSDSPGGTVMFAAVLGFLGACVAIYGVVARSPRAARGDAVGQAVGAMIVVALIEAFSEPGSGELEFLFPLALVILLDVLVVVSAGQLRRRAR